MKKKKLAWLIPDRDTLVQICERANFLSYCQKQFELVSHPSPIGHGWDLINGKCRPVRNFAPPLPDVLSSTDTTISDERSEESSNDDTDSSADESSDDGSEVEDV